MNNDITDIKDIIDKIEKLVNPVKIILFHRKIANNGLTMSFKICIITQSQNKLEIEKKIYKSVDSDVPFDVVLYTIDEWEKLKSNDNSFANKILKRGKVINGQA